MYENLKNFENLKEKNHNSVQWPPDNWPCVLDHLAIGLVDTKYTKLGKKKSWPIWISHCANLTTPIKKQTTHYMCSSLLQLAPESRDLYQTDKRITVL